MAPRPAFRLAPARIITVAVVVALASVGCGGSPNVTDDPAFTTAISSAIEEATAQGASQAQLGILTEASKADRVTIEQARDARRRYAECAAARGVKVSFRETIRPDGWVSTATSVSAESAEGNAIAEACELQEALWVTRLYANQPVAENATKDYLNSQEPRLRACLEAAGLILDKDSTGMELAKAAIRVTDAELLESGTKCLVNLGVDGF